MESCKVKRILPDWIEGFLEYTEETEPPKNFKRWVGISAVAACMKRKCWLDWDIVTTLYPNMYIVLVAPSGKGRKSTAMKPGLKLLREVGIEPVAESITREALIRKFKDAEFTELIDPATGAMRAHSSLTVFASELAVFLGCGYNNPQFISTLTDWFDSNDVWKYETKHQGKDEINGIWLNLIGATTPSLLQTTLPPDAIGGGLTSRMIFVYEPRKEKTIPFSPVTKQLLALEQQLISDLEQIKAMVGNFKIDGEFIDRYFPWYAASEDNPPFEDHNFDGYMERRATHIRKLAMIVSASRSNEMVIRAKDFDRALEIMRITEQKMPNTFSHYGARKDAGLMRTVLLTIAQASQNGLMCKRSALIRKFGRDLNLMDLDHILDGLKKAKYIRMVATPDDIGIEYLPDEGNTPGDVQSELR